MLNVIAALLRKTWRYSTLIYPYRSAMDQQQHRVETSKHFPVEADVECVVQTHKGSLISTGQRKSASGILQ